jgi:hypothetical protein
MGAGKVHAWFFVRRLEGKRPLGRAGRRWYDNIKMDHQEWDGETWTGFVWLTIRKGGEDL